LDAVAEKSRLFEERTRVHIYFYLDTNVYRHIIESGDRVAEALLVGNRTRVKLAAVTVLELIEDMWTSDQEATFRQRKRAIELARRVVGDKILPADGEFLLKKVFDPSGARSGGSARMTKRWLDAVVRYRSRADLVRPIPYSIGRVMFGFADMAKRLQKRRLAYVEMLDRYKEDIIAKTGLPDIQARGGRISGPYAAAVNKYFETDEWRTTYVNMHARAVGAQTPDAVDALRFCRRMQAACEFSATILRQSLCDGYRYDRKANDALDEAHLRYLCDDSLVFVTNDYKLRTKISEASRGRVITATDLIARLTQ
jgi:hypothetical protein